MVKKCHPTTRGSLDHILVNLQLMNVHDGGPPHRGLFHVAVKTTRQLSEKDTFSTHLLNISRWTRSKNFPSLDDCPGSFHWINFFVLIRFFQSVSQPSTPLNSRTLCCLCVFLSLKGNFDALMEYSALCSPCAGSLRGATHPRTLTNYTPQTPCTQQLCPSALKEAFPCSARCWRPHAAAHRDPSVLFAAVAFDLLLCAAVLQPSQTSVGLEGWIWLYGVSDADKPSSRYSTSSVIFIPHVFNFSLFLPTPKILNRL